MGHGHMLRALLALCALRACSASKVEGEARDQARQAGVWDDIVEEEDFRDFEGARVLGASAGGSMGPTTPTPPPQIQVSGTCKDGAFSLTEAECYLYLRESNIVNASAIRDGRGEAASEAVDVFGGFIAGPLPEISKC